MSWLTDPGAPGRDPLSSRRLQRPGRARLSGTSARDFAAATGLQGRKHAADLPAAEALGMGFCYGLLGVGSTMILAKHG